MDTAEGLRRQREDTSVFDRLFDYVRENEAALATEGRRPVLGGLLSKEPVMGVDTIRYEGIGPMIAGLLDPVARGIDAPRAAAQGLIPAEDMLGEAFGTAGVAMGGGGVMPKPKGALGANALRGGGKAPNDFGQGWSDAYHWTRSPDPFEQFDPDRSTSAMSQLGPHVGTKAAAEARIRAFPNDASTGQMLELRADTRRPFLNPRTNEPWSETGLEVFISQFADEHGVDRRQAAPLMRRMLSEEGYTDIPYVNDVEDAGSVSNIMLVDRPRGSDAVLRRSDAAFDPSRRASPNLTAANASPAAGLLSQAGMSEQQAERTEQILQRMGLQY